jgi:hypothetical protein
LERSPSGLLVWLFGIILKALSNLWKRLLDRAHNIQMGLELNKLVDLGLVDMEWSEEHGEMMFSLTHGGKEWRDGVEKELFGDA